MSTPRQHNATGSEKAAVDSQRLFLYIGLVVVLSCAIYINSIFSDFTFDDHDMVEHNTLIRSLSPSNIGTIFSTSWWWGGARQQSHEYRPFTVLSFAVWYKIAGLRAWFYHLVNVMLNAGVGVLVLLLARRLTRSLPFALAVAVLYTTHPIHTEAVNNIVGQAELLSAFFFMLGFLLFLRAMRLAPQGRRLLIVAGSVVYFIAVLSKETAIMLPVLVLLVHWFMYKEERDDSGKRGKESLPHFVKTQWVYYTGFAIAVIIYFALRINALDGLTSPTMKINYLDNVLQKPHLAGDHVTSFLTAFKIMGLYFYRLVFPLQLSADYSYDAIALAHSPVSPGVLLTLCAVIAVIVYVYVYLKRNDWLPVFVACFFFILFLPVSNFFIIIGAAMGERLMYVPSLGFCLLLVHVLRQQLGDKKYVFWGLIALLVLLYSARTFVRNFDWKNDFTLYRATVDVVPRCTRAHFNLGNQYKERGELEQALHHYQTSYEIAPNYGAPLSGIGEVLRRQGKLEEAEDIFRKVIAMEDRYHIAHFQLALVLDNMRRYDEAIAEYKKTIELRPTFAAAYHNVGTVYLKKGEINNAEASFKKALDVNPRLYVAAVKLAETYNAQGETDRAIEQLEHAIEIDPRDPTAYFYLGKLYAAEEATQPAIENLNKALSLAPNNADLHYELARVYLVQAQDARRAAYHFQQTLKHDPNHPQKNRIRRTLQKLKSALEE